MKDKIISAAITQFNELGINKTSFRNIAASLNISDGHVRYYFKTKESLLLAIFEKMDIEILLLADESQDETQDVSHYLKNKLKQAFTVMVNYSFFFIETPNTFKQFPELAIGYSNLVKNRKEFFIHFFQKLKSEGYFKETFSDQLQEWAFYNIFIISDSWIRYYTIINNKKPDEEAIDFHRDLAFSILLPYIQS